MCVIIFVPEGEDISKSELKNAWTTNPDGAGYAMRTPSGVMYSRGYMNFNAYYEAIKHKIGRGDIVLHFRITTSKQITEMQTHPYEVGRKERLKGITTAPVVCMNGIISGQTIYRGYNDTMSFISDHLELFNVIAEHQDKGGQEVLNLLEGSTGSRWAVITPEEVKLSKGFTEYDGRYYSNLNHINTYWSYSTGAKSCGFTYRKPKDYLRPKLFNQVKKDKDLYTDVQDFLYFCTEGEAEALNNIHSKAGLKNYMLLSGFL